MSLKLCFALSGSFPLPSESTLLQPGETELQRAADEDFSIWNP